MPTIQFRDFAGELPKLHPRRLPDGHAIQAENTDFRKASIKPLDGLGFHESTTYTRVQAIHKTRYDRWVYFSNPTQVVDSVVGDDPYERIFYVRSGQDVRVANRARAGTGSIELGVPAPNNKPGVTVTGEAGEEETPESRTYTVTLVNEFGEEGPPSPPSDVVDVTPSQSVDVSFSSISTGLATRMRIYRSTGASYLFVDEVTSGETTYSDSSDSLVLGEALPSMNWYAPPDELNGLISVPGGFLAAWRNNELLFSELQLPHAWPPEYRQSVDWDIVGAGTFGNSVVVCTEGAPYISQGSTPDSMQLQKIPSDQSCASADSIVSMTGGVVYASPEGLVRVSASGVEPFTRAIFTEDQWEALNPPTMRGDLWEGLYVCMHDTGAFVINPGSAESGIVNLTFVDNGIGAVYNDLSLGDLYVADGSDVYKWGEGEAQDFTWRSRTSELPAPDTMKFVQVWADTYPVTVRVFDDAEDYVEATVTSPDPTRLPTPRLSRTYSLQLSGGGEITSAVLSSTMAAMRSV